MRNLTTLAKTPAIGSAWRRVHAEGHFGTMPLYVHCVERVRTGAVMVSLMSADELVQPCACLLDFAADYKEAEKGGSE